MKPNGLGFILMCFFLLAACDPQVTAPTDSPLATFKVEATTTPIVNSTPTKTASPTENVKPSLEFSANFVPAWYERSLGHSDGLEIPITIGLMEEVVKNAQYPIKEVHMTVRGANAVASLFLHSAWGRYRDLMDHRDITYDQYIELLLAGEGKVEVFILDEDGVAHRTVEIDPREGFSIVWTDESRMPVADNNLWGFFLGADERGRLLFATNGYRFFGEYDPEVYGDELDVTFIFDRFQDLAAAFGRTPNKCMKTGNVLAACGLLSLPSDYGDSWAFEVYQGVEDDILFFMQ